MTVATIAGLTSIAGPLTVAIAAVLAAFATGWWTGRHVGRIPRADAGGRQSLFDELGRCFADWQRRETPFSLLIVDVPGPAATAGAASQPGQEPPAFDLLAPLGGALRVVDRPFQTAVGTVAIVMSSTDLCQATRVAARVRQCFLDALPQSVSGHDPIRLACGLAEVRPEDSIMSLFERAREAVAIAKRGEVRVTHFHDGDRPRPLVQTA